MHKKKIPRIKNYDAELVKQKSLLALEKAIKLSGGWAAFIRKLGIYDQLITGWKNSMYGVDPRYAIAIERLTRNQLQNADTRGILIRQSDIVTREELRMDIFQQPDARWN